MFFINILCIWVEKKKKFMPYNHIYMLNFVTLKIGSKKKTLRFKNRNNVTLKNGLDLKFPDFLGKYPKNRFILKSC